MILSELQKYPTPFETSPEFEEVGLTSLVDELGGAEGGPRVRVTQSTPDHYVLHIGGGHSYLLQKQENYLWRMDWQQGRRCITIPSGTWEPSVYQMVWSWMDLSRATVPRLLIHYDLVRLVDALFKKWLPFNKVPEVPSDWYLQSDFYYESFAEDETGFNLFSPKSGGIEVRLWVKERAHTLWMPYWKGDLVNDWFRTVVNMINPHTPKKRKNIVI